MYQLEGDVMKNVKYGVTVKFNFVQPFEGIENLKDNNEFANDLVQFVCDEGTNAGAVVSYEILESTLDIE